MNNAEFGCLMMTDEQMNDIYRQVQRKHDLETMMLQLKSMRDADEIPKETDIDAMAEELVDDYRKTLDNDHEYREMELDCAYAAVRAKIAETEKEYTVSIKVDGRLDVRVSAKSFEEAREKAELDAGNQDWNTMESIEIEAVNAEDEDGKFIDF